MADTATETAPQTDGVPITRPEKPDDAKYAADLKKAEEDHKASQAKFEAIRAKLDSARGGKDSPANDRWTALVEDQKSIRAKQAQHKTTRGNQQAQLDKNDEAIKKLIKEQTEQRNRLGFKNVGELDAQIQRLQKQVDSGQMRLVDEKKALAQITTYNKQRKEFKSLEDSQKLIDQKKTENAEVKKSTENAEWKELSAQYEKNQKELDDIKASRDDTNKNFNVLKAEREKLYNEQKEKYSKIREIKDAHFKQKREYKEYDDMIYQQRRDRQKAERDAFEKEKRKRFAEQKLEEAGEPAYLDQIRTAEGLIRHFDPSAGGAEEEKGPGQYAASAQRTIDDSGFKGMKVMKKEEEDFFAGSGGKKKGKGKKGAAAASAPEAGKLNMNIGIIEELGRVGVDPPSTQADVPNVVDKLKEKVAEWKKNQDDQTQKNIEKAKKEIERLEQETDAAAVEAPKANTSRRREDRGKKVSQKNAGANGDINATAEMDQEQDAAADVTKELKEASIEDQTTEATA